LVDRADLDQDAAGHQEVDGLTKELDLLATTAAALVVEGRVEVDHLERMPRDAVCLEAARAEHPNVGVSLRDPSRPAGVQFDREDMVLRNAESLADLDAGLCFSSTWVEGESQREVVDLPFQHSHDRSESREETARFSSCRAAADSAEVGVRAEA
jgi:hypothetical protein